ncbi:TrmH family RNA methyltransferase [Flavicella marina]|uniref:TrmH family RNA methyltransferase n=1 Tax=Flavicella marina TaxID=1475951 RepID=UPI001264C2A8|nr:RNA methyltransferase [Flavicella marina]
MELSKNQIKLIKSLEQKKQRLKHQLFIAEGKKVVSELLSSSFELEKLFVSEDTRPFFEAYDFQLIKNTDFKKISALKTPNGVLAVFKIPKEKEVQKSGMIVALDSINDPGNLGTIIRLCDWFGVVQLVCSLDTVDCFNAKVVQATMGSLTRVNITYLQLDEYLSKVDVPVFCADMEGDNIYDTELPTTGVLVMGNEANGISKTVENLCSNKLTIPRFGTIQETESLNVATATAIILSEFKRG